MENIAGGLQDSHDLLEVRLFFYIEKSMDSVHIPLNRVGSQSTVD
jgi:hypothetical protein